MNDTSILLSSSRVFFILSKQLYTDNEVYLEKQQLECLIKFLWIRMDHYLDGVRHMARDTMTNIIKMKGIFQYILLFDITSTIINYSVISIFTYQ